MSNSEKIHLKANNEVYLFFKYMGSVGLAQAVTKTILAPMERMKIIFQVQNAFLIEESSKIKSIGSFFVRVPKEQGLKALFRGNGANILTIVTKNIVTFTLYDNINRFWLAGGENLYEGFDFIARKGTIAFLCGFTTLLLTYPFDLALTKLSLDHGNSKDRAYKGILNSLKQTATNSGYRSLYKGFLFSTLATIPFFSTFALSLRGFQEIKATSEALSGYEIAGASLIAHTVCYPFDTIKRRLQISTAKYTEPYNGVRECVNKIRKVEGLGALYRGLGVSVGKNILAVPLQAYILDTWRKSQVFAF